ncbi:MAG: hypothetical protein NTY03_09490 [Candidatus Bathyarchaeota archaeon]|nr:hypothetical protein [Candidatus Bathyarchaeota archaeon]
MKVAVIGAGLMGPTVSMDCLGSPDVSEVLLIDIDRARLDHVSASLSVDIWCGGIPQDPKPPLDYKIVFGGPYLPLYPGPVKVIEGGSECSIPRYTLGEPICFEGIDRPLECFYEGFPETLESLPKFKGVERCTEKTVRYAGYCEKVNFLDSCGLLSRDPVSIKGINIAPFEAFSKIIHPKVRMEEDERDITVLRVIVDGEKGGSWASYTFDMVDFYDMERKVTSMAKTTAYTAAIVARMLGRGEIPERGFVTPVKGIKGRLLKHLLDELAKRGVTIKQTYAHQSNDFN